MTLVSPTHIWIDVRKCQIIKEKLFRGVSDKGLDSKLKLKMQTWDSLTGPSKGHGTQVTVKTCWPLVYDILVNHFGIGQKSCALLLLFRRRFVVCITNIFSNILNSMNKSCGNINTLRHVHVHMFPVSGIKVCIAEVRTIQHKIIDTLQGNRNDSVRRGRGRRMSSGCIFPRLDCGTRRLVDLCTVPHRTVPDTLVSEL